MVCDQRPAQGIEFGVPAFYENHSAFEAKDITAVAIATPSHTHCKLAIQALQAGKDVFVEKPMALCRDDAVRMAVAAKAHGRVLMVDNLMTYHPALIEMAKRVTRGGIGELRRIDTVRIKPDDGRSEEPVLWRLGPHDVGIALELMGGRYPELIMGAGDNNVSWLSMARGSVLSMIHVELRPSKAATITLEGTKGKLRFDGLSDYLTDEESATFYKDANPLKRICQDFVWHSERGIPVPGNVENAVDVVRAIEEGQKWISLHTPQR
jgi:predicted dehydrogenase